MAPKPKLVVLHPVHGYKIKPAQDLKTMKRNARERNRVQTVNCGFERLRLMVPSAAADKKMSKVNILGHAVEYIHCLHSFLQQCNNGGHSMANPMPSPAGFMSPNPAMHHMNQSMTSEYYGHQMASPMSPNVFSPSHNVYANQMASPAAGYTSPMTPPSSIDPAANRFCMTPAGSSHSNYDDSGIYSPKSSFTPNSNFSPANFTPSSVQYSPMAATSAAPLTPEFSPYYNTNEASTSHFNFQGCGAENDRIEHEKMRQTQISEESSDDDLLDAIAEWQNEPATTFA